MSSDLFGKSAKFNDVLLEKEWQERVMTMFTVNGWRVYAIPDSRRASLAGYPDLTIWKGSRLIWAELKREKGRLSESQKTIISELENIAEVYVWRPSDYPFVNDIAEGRA